MAGLIPQACIDEVLERTDLLELIDGYIPLKKHGRNYLCCCPFHQEKTPSFNVIPKKQFYYCFGCGASGNAIGFLMQYLNLSFVEAVEDLATRLGIAVKSTEQKHKINVDKNLHVLLSKVNAFFQENLHKNGNEALGYLKTRGISLHTAKEYQLGFAPSGWHSLEHKFEGDKKELLTTGMLIQNDQGKIYDRYRHRITFPIYDRHGKIIGFGGRALRDEDKPKYLNSPETPLFQKNRELYGLYQVLCHNDNPKQLIVVEGYMDVIALSEHGVKNAVATLGTATSFMHIQLLNKYASEIVFCFDGDEAGQKAAWRALEQAIPLLNSHLDLRFVFLPKEHDPDSLIREQGKDAFLTMIQKAMPFARYFTNTLSQGLSLRETFGKSQLLDKAKAYFNQMPESTYKTFLIEELVRLTKLQATQITSILKTDNPSMPNTVKSTITRSPIRIAIALLLQDPSLYNHCGPIDLDCFHSKEETVLHKLLQLIAQNPLMNTGALLEQWRDKPEFEAISKLAAWDHLIPEENRLSELIDILGFLKKQGLQKEVQRLIEQSRRQGLTMEERHLLQKLIKQQKQIAV